MAANPNNVTVLHLANGLEAQRSIQALHGKVIGTKVSIIDRYFRVNEEERTELGHTKISLMFGPHCASFVIDAVIDCLKVITSISALLVGVYLFQQCRHAPPFLHTPGLIQVVSGELAGNSAVQAGATLWHSLQLHLSTHATTLRTKVTIIHAATSDERQAIRDCLGGDALVRWWKARR